jgi:hypothetical protein
MEVMEAMAILTEVMVNLDLVQDTMVEVIKG